MKHTRSTLRATLE